MSKDGGPAFPVVCDDQRDTPMVVDSGFSGMSLRDYFAAKALTAMVGQITREDARREAVYSLTAIACYKFADAMIKARES